MTVNYLTTKQERGMIKLDPVANYTDYMLHQAFWDRFWKKDYGGKKEDTILDYGCGPCWSVFVGNTLGFKNIVPLEIDAERDHPKGSHFKNFYNFFGIQPVYWNGKKMPFEGDSFDSVVAKASILKLTKTRFLDMLNELIRVTKRGGFWYIAPAYQYNRFIKVLEKRHLKHVMKNKRIKIFWWSFHQQNQQKNKLEQDAIKEILRTKINDTR